MIQFKDLKPGKRGRKPGSSRKNKSKRETAEEKFQRLQEERLQKLEQQPEIKKLLRNKKVMELFRRLDAQEARKLKKAMLKSKLLEKLVREGKVKTEYLYNLVIHEVPGAHMREIIIQK